ncbi:MAG: putative DNA binding domain-containing protein, partial [archaeon]|nr:putative DNA binding domain-containing protein [archaeon]
MNNPNGINQLLVVLKDMLTEFKFPLANILLTSELRFTLVQIVFNGKCENIIKDIFKRAVEFFNYRQSQGNLGKDFLEECKNTYGIYISVNKPRDAEKEDEKLYYSLNTLSFQISYAINDMKNIKKYINIVEASLKRCNEKYNSFISNPDNYLSSKEYFKEYLDKVINSYNDFKKKIPENGISTTNLSKSTILPVTNITTTIINNPNFNIFSSERVKPKTNLKDLEFKEEPKIIQNNLIEPKKDIKNFRSTTLIKERKFFYLNEILKEEEDLSTEYKAYNFPLNKMCIDTLKKQICGFLNAKGGRIYLGINDSHIVEGNEFSIKEKDITRNEIANYLCDFYPKCRTDKIKVYFIPLKDYNTEKYVPNKYVIKIIISQGDPKKLYSTDSKLGYHSYLRMPGQIVCLSAEEIFDQIIKRNNSKEECLNENEFNDPEPEKPDFSQLDEIGKNGQIEKEEGNKEQIGNTSNTSPPPNNKYKKSEKNFNYSLKVTNISRDISVDHVFDFFKDSKAVDSVFFGDKRSNRGYGYLNYMDREIMLEDYNKYNRKMFEGKL